jgi:hypothetical protein
MRILLNSINMNQICRLYHKPSSVGLQYVIKVCYFNNMLWVLDQMNRFIEHLQIVITIKYDTVTGFHTTDHSTPVYSVYFH